MSRQCKARTRVAGILASAILAAAGPAVAQRGPMPAELPPDSFTGDRFVDSRGCVFTPADGPRRQVWVAMLGPDMQPLCGFAPTPTQTRRGLFGWGAPQAPAQPQPQPEVPSVASVTPGGGAAVVSGAIPGAPLGATAFVQVGAFANAQNAERVREDLLGLGFPVSSDRVRSGGRELSLVAVGPFASPAEAQAALAAVRARGFRDAYLRR